MYHATLKWVASCPRGRSPASLRLAEFFFWSETVFSSGLGSLTRLGLGEIGSGGPMTASKDARHSMAQPLTKLNKSGALCRRRQSRRTSMEAERLRRHDTGGGLLFIDQQCAEYLKSECLVHLIRELTRRNATETRNAIVLVLLDRCDNILKSKIDGSRAERGSLGDDILHDFALVLASDDDENPAELDYFECRFNHAFRSFRIDARGLRSDTLHVCRFRPTTTIQRKCRAQNTIYPAPVIHRRNVWQQRSYLIAFRLNCERRFYPLSPNGLRSRV